MNERQSLELTQFATKSRAFWSQVATAPGWLLKAPRALSADELETPLARGFFHLAEVTSMAVFQ
jgi:hypothetical protein